MYSRFQYTTVDTEGLRRKLINEMENYPIHLICFSVSVQVFRKHGWQW